MKLSLKVEYSCRVLTQLAKTYGQDRLAHIEDLANAEEIPANYLVQILNEMRNGGLITSRRGKQGGYALARAPEDITIYDVVQVIEGDLMELNLNGKGQSGERVATFWKGISKMLREKASAYTIRDFMPGENEQMYYI